MSKAFTRESDAPDLDKELEAAPPLPAGSRNYMTPGGFARLKAELASLVEKDRPEVVATVAWAASNGDRSENGDYIYGKKRLREIDRRIRFLIRRLDNAEVVDPHSRRESENADQIFFGATVTVSNARGEERTVSIVGVDEIDTARGNPNNVYASGGSVYPDKVGLMYCSSACENILLRFKNLGE